MSSNAPLVLNNYVPILVPRNLLPVLDFAFEVRVDFDRRMVCGPICGGGNMGFTGVGGGTIRGPRFTAGWAAQRRRLRALAARRRG